MAKKITLNQLAQKKYTLLDSLPPAYQIFLGEPEASFDMIVYGDSGNGKSNMIADFIGTLLTSLEGARCEYIAYEEGHGKTIQDTFIKRAHLVERVGNRITIVDRYNFEELNKMMSKQRSAKIWVIDSAQASGLTAKECLLLKNKYIKSRGGKIIIYVSWADGKHPNGVLGKSLEYYADIKVRVEKLVAFPKSRYGGNHPFIIFEPLAKQRWGKEFVKIKREIDTAIKEFKKQTNEQKHIIEPEGFELEG